MKRTTRKTFICLLICLTIVGVAVGTLGACFKKPGSSATSSSDGATETYNVFVYDEDMNLVKKCTFSASTLNTVSVADFAKTGYKFTGIYDLSTGIMIFNAQGYQSPTIIFDVDFTAVVKYSPISYQLVFNAGEGRLANSSDYIKNLAYGESVGLFPVPDYEGKDFDGWFDENDNRFSVGDAPVYTKFTVDGFAISGEIIKLHAKYTDKYCKVTLLYSDGSFGRELKVKYGEKLPDMTEYFKDDGTRTVTGFGVSATATVAYGDPVVTDLELYAIWQYYKNVNFVYTSDDIRVIKVLENGKMATLPDGERAGYNFDGWYLSELLTGAKITSVSFGSLAETYYAKWLIATYKIKFIADGKLVSESEFDINNTDIFVPPVPAKAHYSGKWENYTLEFKNMTVNAIYEPELIKLTMMSGSDITYRMVEYGESFSLDVPKKKGHVFLGWYYGEEQITDENGNSLNPYLFDGEIAVTAKWEGVKCRLFFETDGGSTLDSVDVEYGKPYKLTQVPEKNGYYFAGWFDETLTTEYIQEITLTENTIIYAKWILSVAVGDADELKAIADNPSLNYHLTANINLKGEEWTPLQSFSGMLDGNGYKIYNFTLRQNIANSAFIIKNTGTIKNVTFANVEFSNTASGGSYYYLSVVCANNEGRIINVTAEKVNLLVNVNNTNVNNTIYFGVIAAVNSGLIKNSAASSELIFKADVRTDAYDLTATTYMYVGGVIGRNGGTVSNIQSDFTIDASEYVYTYSQRASSPARPNKSSTKASYLSIGGAIGNAGGTTTNAKATFNCTFVSDAGGGVGGGAPDYFSKRYTYIGGVIGYLTDGGNASGCYSDGSAAFTRKGSRASEYEFTTGGVVGCVSDGTLDNCASDVNLTLKSGFGGVMGGIAGLVRLKGKASNVAYYGTITTESFTGGYFGGLAGKVEGALTKGYSGCSIVSTSTQIADIAGQVSNTGSVSKTIGNGNIKKAFASNSGSSAHNYIIGVDYGTEFLTDRGKLFDELCMYEVELWNVDENGLYLISFPRNLSSS